MEQFERGECCCCSNSKRIVGYRSLFWKLQKEKQAANICCQGLGSSRTEILIVKFFLVQGMKEILGKQQQLGDLSAFIFFNESGSHLIEKLFGQFFQYYINDKKIMKCCVNNSNFQHKQLILLIKLPMIIRKINYSCCRLKHILATFHQLMFHYFISLSKYKSVLETYNLK